MHKWAWVLGVALVAGCGSTESTQSDESGRGSFEGGEAVDTDHSAAAGAGGVGGMGGAAGSSFGTGGSGGAGGAGGGALPSTNVNLGGSQDFGFFRSQLAAGVVPRVGEFDAAGFFAEHHTALPPADCGERVCLQTMLGVLGNLVNGENCTMLQLGLNSPIAADPDARPPLNLAVVVDTSGSMLQAGKIDFVRQGLGLLIDGMKDGDRLALIRYADVAEVVVPMQDVAGNRVTLRAAAEALEADGGTNLHDGLQQGYQEAMNHFDGARQNRVILLSDGNPTVGITTTPEITAMSRGYNSEGVGLSTIGLGVDFNVELMRGLAEQGDGNFYFLEDSGAVSEVFDEELSYFTVPVAFDLEVTLVSGDHYAFRRAFGSSFWQESADGGTLSVPSVFLAHRESDEDVTADGGRRGGGSALMIELMPTLSEDEGLAVQQSQVAVIDVQFREPGSTEVVKQQVEVTFPHAPWVTPAAGEWVSSDVSVIQKSFVMLNIYVAFEMASEMFYAHAHAMAVDGLSQVIAAVEDYNQEIQDVDIDYDLVMLRDMRALIELQIAEPEPITLREDPWPCD